MVELQLNPKKNSFDSSFQLKSFKNDKMLTTERTITKMVHFKLYTVIWFTKACLFHTSDAIKILIFAFLLIFSECPFINGCPLYPGHILES